MNSPVAALAVSGTNLYAGGTRRAGYGQLHRQMGRQRLVGLVGISGVDDAGVYALAVSGTNLYAGGGFTTAGGVPANYIAKWDGSAWSALGSGSGRRNSYVYALAADGAGHLFVGGDFSLAGTNVSPYIAQANLGSAPTILMPTANSNGGGRRHRAFRSGRHRRTGTSLSMVPERHQYAQLRQQ